MQMIADILMGLGALGASVYCMVLARRLKRFNQLESGMGGAIAVLSAQVDDMTKALNRAQATAATSAEQLRSLTERAEQSAQRLELLMAMSQAAATPGASVRSGGRRMKTPRPAPAPAPAPKPAARKPRRRIGRGSLVLIAALFAASGLVRFGSGFALALDSAEATPAAAETAECVTEPGVMQLYSEVQTRERKLAEREKVLSDRSQAITLAEKRIEARLASLVEAEQNLAQTVTIADKAADEDVTRLVTVYENMKPKDAAPLFSAMSPDFAAGFLSRMRPETSAAVMAALDPKVAYTISVIMAGRNAGAPQN